MGSHLEKVRSQTGRSTFQYFKLIRCYNQDVDGGSSSVAERLTVAQDVAGSIPARRPKLTLL